MDQHEILGEAEEPDLSDLAVVILNVETRDGRQLSMVWAAEDERLAIVQEGNTFHVLRTPRP